MSSELEERISVAVYEYVRVFSDGRDVGADLRTLELRRRRRNKDCQSRCAHKERGLYGQPDRIGHRIKTIADGRVRCRWPQSTDVFISSRSGEWMSSTIKELP